MPKATRKALAKTSAKPDPSARRSMNLSLTEDAYRRLSHHAIATGTSVSAIIVEFAMGLPEYKPSK